MLDRLPPSASRLVLPLLAAAAIAGCGDDGEERADVQTAASSSEPTAHVDLSEARTVLEEGPVGLVWEAVSGDANVLPEIEPDPTESITLSSRTGSEFDLLVFGTPAQARAAWDSAIETEAFQEGGRAIRSLNLIAVFDDRGDDSGLAAHVSGVFRELAAACTGRTGDLALRRLCFGDRGADPVPPAGEGTDLDELAPIGAEVTVGGLRYRVITARQLNPRIAPAEEYVDGRLPARNSLFFGVFVEVCNEQDTAQRSTGRLTLIDAFGQEVQPVGLDADNPFAYTPQVIAPDDCAPATDTAAERTAGGALVLFEFPNERLGDRPLGLRIVSRDGRESATVQVDV